MNCQELYIPCKDKAKKHSILYHYTNLESFLKILSSRSFRLTQLSLLNDIEEENRIDCIYRNKVFAACFNHDQEESIPLWKMYTKDKYGIRLGFENIAFSEDITNYYFIENNETKNFPDHGWQIRDACTVDILIKRNVWKFESETRARVYIDVTKNVCSIYRDGKELMTRYPPFNHIDCRLNENCISTMTIIFNPFMEDKMKLMVKAAVKSYLPNFYPYNFFNSTLENRIRL